MEEELRILDNAKPTEKVYNEKGIILGALLGGPIAAGYFLIENYKSLDKQALVNKAWGITIGSTVLYFLLGYVIQEMFNISAVPVTVACVMGGRQIFKQEQAIDVETHIQQGGEVYSNWRAAGISLLFFIGMLIPIGIGAMLYAPDPIDFEPTPTELVASDLPRPARSTTSSNSGLMKSVVASLETKSYGDAAHVIVYNNFFFTESKIDSIAEELTALGFFDASNQKYVYLEKVLFDYQFSITDASADVTTKQTIDQYEQLRISMETFLKDGKVHILLMDEDLEVVLAEFTS